MHDHDEIIDLYLFKFRTFRGLFEHLVEKAITHGNYVSTFFAGFRNGNLR